MFDFFVNLKNTVTEYIVIKKGAADMNSESWATVKEILYEDEDIQILSTFDTSNPAMLYKQLTAPVTKGTRIKLNTTATGLKLGTGGYDIVKDVMASKRYPNHLGHIMKLRYTPGQHSVQTIEEFSSPYHEFFQQEFSLKKKPILLAELHSMVPLIYYFAQEFKANSSCCVIFEDSASLMLNMSKHLRQLKKESWFTSITCGQCVGGDFEAINLVTALQFATDYLSADLIVISVGPGVVGTGTRFGFSAIEIANWANTVGALNGVPVWIPRLSFKDKRERHNGLSHHTLTPLASLALSPVTLVFPFLDTAEKEQIQTQLLPLSLTNSQHQFLFSDLEGNEIRLQRALARMDSLTTMGRTFEEDSVFFNAVAASTSYVLDCKYTS